jgi:hypothetical protein
MYILANIAAFHLITTYNWAISSSIMTILLQLNFGFICGMSNETSPQRLGLISNNLAAE